MATDLEKYLRDTGDPRVIGTGTEKFENAPRDNAKSADGAKRPAEKKAVKKDRR
jgi:hypothetical protein